MKTSDYETRKLNNLPIQIVFNTPFLEGWMQICNGSARQQAPIWYMHLNTIAGEQNHKTWIQTIRKKPNLPRQHLEDFLALIGLPARLAIGEYNGTIIQNPVPPSGWTYPSGEPLPESWHWLWQPDSSTKELMNREIQTGSDLDNYIFSEPKETLFKRAIPHILYDRYGEISDINPIPLLELPRYTKQPNTWAFQF
jgi:hypothetical protein